MIYVCYIFGPLPISPPPDKRAPRGLVSNSFLCKHMSEYECNVYVHDGDVTVRVHSLNRIKRMELHTFFSYNILPRLNCVSFRRDCYSLLKELVILRGGIKIYIFAQDLPGE